jgi:hypothetical protein
MQTLAKRAVQSLTHHRAPPLSLDQLVHQVKDGDTALGPDILLRALEAQPDLFRVLGPWRGPWPSTLRRAVSQACATWVVGLGRGRESGGVDARLKASPTHLRRTVDERSVTDLARWLEMVREGELISWAELSPAPGA